MKSVIQGYISLPSKGKIYPKVINPKMTMRSAKTAEEKKRLNYANNMTYKILSEIIDACIIEGKEISTYDMVIGDFQYMLYQYRIITYGNKYEIQTVSPFTGRMFKVEVNLDELEIHEYADEIEESLTITLPKSKEVVRIGLLTPRALDEIAVREAEILRKNPEADKPSYDLTLKSLIKTVDGQELSPGKLDAYIKDMYVQDANAIVDAHDGVKLGISQRVTIKCPDSGELYEISMPISGEFLRPYSN